MHIPGGQIGAGSVTAILVPAGRGPSAPAFWFIMSMALLAGFISAYPMNWWLVSHHLKHGMMTVRSSHEQVIAGAHETTHDKHTRAEPADAWQPTSKPVMDGAANPVSPGVLARMTILSCVIFGLGLSIAIILGGM